MPFTPSSKAAAWAKSSSLMRVVLFGATGMVGQGIIESADLVRIARASF